MQASIYFDELRWPELKQMAARKAIVLLPIGQTEEHGPHMPVGADTFIAAETARAVAEAAVKEKLPVLTMPAIWCGYSGKDLGNWPGLITMPPEVLIAVVENICLSLGRSGFKKVVIMNGHGHHDAITRVAARKVADASDVCVIVSEIWKLVIDTVAAVRTSPKGGICHACEYEASLMLYLKKRIDLKLAKDEPVKTRSSFVGGDMCTSSKVFWSTWRYQKSKSGTYGCPTHATLEKGRLLFEASVAEYLKLLRDIHAAE